MSCKIPQAVGAIDGTHIPILTPATERNIDYYSRKKRHTINTPAIVGANFMFLDVVTVFPECIHEARVLQHTALFSMARQSEILSKRSDQINNVTIKPVLLGDGAYPLSTWMMKPYSFSPNLTRAEKKINKKLSSTRVSLERALDVLKARWRCLLKRLDNRIENISEVIVSCFALHNFCQLENEEFIDQDGILGDLIRQEHVATNRRNAPRGNQN